MTTPLTVSIIIPTHGAAPFLKWTLLSLHEARMHEACCEVLVVENGIASGTTRETVAQMNSRTSGTELSPLRYVHEPIAGLLAGRHRGLHESEGHVLTYVDDDVIVDAGWFAAISAACGDGAIEIIGGPSRPLYLAATPDWVVDRRKTLRDGWYLGELSLVDVDEDIPDIDLDFIWGLNFTVRRQSLLAAGGFHPDLVPGETWFLQGDGETGLTRKLKQRGAVGRFLKDASVRHVIPASRLSVAYLESRYRYQGICDAYSKLRTENSGASPDGLARHHFGHVLRPSSNTKKFRWPRSRKEQFPHPSGLSYQEGWGAFVAAYRESASIRDWVHRRDYLNEWGLDEHT